MELGITVDYEGRAPDLATTICGGSMKHGLMLVLAATVAPRPRPTICRRQIRCHTRPVDCVRLGHEPRDTCRLFLDRPLRKQAGPCGLLARRRLSARRPSSGRLRHMGRCASIRGLAESTDRPQVPTLDGVGMGIRGAGGNDDTLSMGIDRHPRVCQLRRRDVLLATGVGPR